MNYETGFLNDGDEAGGGTLMLVRRATMGLFVDRTTQQWVARDLEGQFWVVPPVDDPWSHRAPFQPADDSQLEPVPGHYKHMLGLPC